MLQLVKNASQHPGHQAIVSDNQTYTYQQLLDASHGVASLLLDHTPDLAETRVAFMVSPGFDYVRVQWGIWRAGGVAVPLCITYPLPSLQYVIDDTDAQIIVAGPEYAELLAPLAAQKGLRFMTLADIDGLSYSSKKLPNILTDRRAMIDRRSRSP